MSHNIVEVIVDPEDPNELAIQLPDSLRESQGWEIGDTLDWIDNNDGSWTLQKQDTA